MSEIRLEDAGKVARALRWCANRACAECSELHNQYANEGECRAEMLRIAADYLDALSTEHNRQTVQLVKIEGLTKTLMPVTCCRYCPKCGAKMDENGTGVDFDVTT